MLFKKTELQDSYIIELERMEDERGFFARTFCKNEFSRIRDDIEIVQSNISHNAHAGTTRGMHFQQPPFAECKLISCVRGSALDVIIDIRAGSPTF